MLKARLWRFLSEISFKFMGDKAPLPKHQLELLAVFFAWLQGDEIAVAHSARDKKRVVSISLASLQ
jgi:hypothetical protein